MVAHTMIDVFLAGAWVSYCHRHYQNLDSDILHADLRSSTMVSQNCFRHWYSHDHMVFGALLLSHIPMHTCGQGLVSIETGYMY